MPHLLVVTESSGEVPNTVVYRERIALTDLESGHFSGQLVERVGWAVLDADKLEQTGNQDRSGQRTSSAGISAS